MKDIAHDLGVSLMTVSKALRNHSDISQQTRDRVLKRHPWRRLGGRYRRRSLRLKLHVRDAEHAHAQAQDGQQDSVHGDFHESLPYATR